MSNDDTPAFPSQWCNDGDMNATAPDGQLVPPHDIAYMQGMTLRDYFAAKAMQAFAAKWYLNREGEGLEMIDLASDAFGMADEMLNARKP